MIFHQKMTMLICHLMMIRMMMIGSHLPKIRTTMVIPERMMMTISCLPEMTIMMTIILILEVNLLQKKLRTTPPTQSGVLHCGAGEMCLQPETNCFLKRTEQQRANGGLCENCNQPFHNTCLFLPKKTTISYCWECYDDQYFQKIETSITFKKIWEENREQKPNSRKTP